MGALAATRITGSAMRLAVLAALALAPLAASPAAQCGTPGSAGIPQISVSGDLWDSNVTFQLSSAAPGAPWLWGVDASPGPTPLPFGTLCLGASPLLLFNSLGGAVPPVGAGGDVSVTLALSGTTSSLVGVPLYMQAAVLDAAAAGSVALSNQVVFQLRAPRIFVVSDAVALRSLDVLDGLASASGPGGTQLDSIGGSGHSDFAVSRDGRTAFLRNLTFSTTDSVSAWDIASVPATYLGDATASAAGVGTPRQGVVLSSDDTLGYFCAPGGQVHRFDADRASGTFLSITGTATVTLPGPDSLAISSDDALLFVTAGASPPALPSVLMVVDSGTMTEVATVPLTVQSTFLGFVFWSPVGVTPDGKHAVVIAQGLTAGPGFTSNSTLAVVDVDPTSPSYLTEVVSMVLPRFGNNDLAIDPKGFDGRLVYTVDSDAAGNTWLTGVDWVAGTVPVNLPLGSGAIGAEEGGVAFTPGGAYLYVGTAADDRVRVFDGSLALKNDFPMPSAGNPGRMRGERR